MWWLQNESDAGGGFYDTAQIVGSTNASGHGGQLAYQLVTGGTKATLTTTCNTTGVKATGPSTTCAQDVEVRASLDGFSAVSTVKLAVNTFKTARRYTPQPPNERYVILERRVAHCLVIPFGDEIAVAAPQAGAIQPTTPQSPLGNTLVDSIPFYARLGSQQPGKGLLVMSTDQQRYVDHGDHKLAPYVP